MCGEGAVDEPTMDRWVDSGAESEETENKPASKHSSTQHRHVREGKTPGNTGKWSLEASAVR